MQPSHNYTFLLDENVSLNLKILLKSKGYNVETVQDLDESSIKNSKLIELVRIRNNILITYDKDFLFLHKASEISLIVVDIHPNIDEFVLPAFEKFLKVFNPNDLNDHIIILYEDNFKLKKKVKM